MVMVMVVMVVMVVMKKVQAGKIESWQARRKGLEIAATVLFLHQCYLIHTRTLTD